MCLWSPRRVWPQTWTRTAGSDIVPVLNIGSTSDPEPTHWFTGSIFQTQNQRHQTSEPDPTSRGTSDQIQTRKIDCNPDPCQTRKILLIPKLVRIESGPNFQHCIVPVLNPPGLTSDPTRTRKIILRPGPVRVILGWVGSGWVGLGWVGSGRVGYKCSTLHCTWS